MLPADLTGLPRDSVVNVSQLLTLDRGFPTEQAGALAPRLQGSWMEVCAPFCNCSHSYRSALREPNATKNPHDIT